MIIDLMKNTPAYLLLKKDIDSNSLSHAYLVTTEDGLARKHFLTLAAIAINCKNACMQCGVCTRILKGIHVDTKTYDGANMSVRDINALVDDTQIRSTEGGKKIYLIDCAEGLSAAAQNKLLKTYEEPGEDVVVFLAASSQSGILTTIRSRGKLLHIPPFATTDIINVLVEDGCSVENAEVAAAYAQGSLERAQKMSGDESYRQAFAETLEAMLSLRNSKQLIDYINLPIFNKANIALTLDFMEIILSDILILASGANVELKTAHRDYDLRQIQKSFTAAGAAMALLAINEGRKMLHFNINATSVAEKILFDILEARYKWQ